MGFFDKLFGSGKKNIDFTPSSELMPEEKFWKIIETTFRNSKGDFELQQEELSKELHKLPIQEIILFDNKFRQLRGLAYNWQLWAAIYIIHGGCSDDGFTDFRDWIIAQGKEFYNKTVSDPASLVYLEKEKFDIDWEGMGYIPSTVFEELSGESIPSNFPESFEITGVEWKEEGEDLKNMFPRLWEKYSND